MKKLVLMLALLLALTGCGQKAEVPAAGSPAEEAPAEETPEAETPAREDRNPTAAELGRKEQEDLVFLIEGLEETVPAGLHIGQGYSIYIPYEGWQLEEDVEDGVPRETWESILNDDVELTVLHLGERTLEQAQDWVRAEEDGYQLIEDKQGGLGGTDTGGLEMLEVRFHPSGSGMYAVLYKCPMEAAEGFGTRLGVMADTFQAME